MKIKSFTTYKLSHGTKLEFDLEKMEEFGFSECHKTQASSLGWVEPQAGEGLVYSAHGAKLLMLKQQERVLPGPVVNEYLQNKIEDFEARENYMPGRKVREQMKEELIISLLPQAFLRSAKIPVVYYPAEGLLFVLESPKKADPIIAHLRETLGSLPVSIIKTEDTPSTILTNWVANPELLPEDFTLGESVKLVDKEKSEFKANHADLFSEDIKNHINSGSNVTELKLIWKDNLSFQINDELTISTIKDTTPSEAISFDDDAARNAHEFAVFTTWHLQFVRELVKAFGGFSKPAVSNESEAKLTIEVVANEEIQEAPETAEA